MAIVVPFVAPDGSVKKGWFIVKASKAGDVLMKSCNPPKLFWQKATELVLKLAAGHELTDAEKTALRLLGALMMIGTNRTQNQLMGFRTLKDVLGDQPVALSDAEKRSALEELGLA